MEVFLKSFSSLGSLLLALTLAACGGGGDDNSGGNTGGGGNGSGSGGQAPAVKLNSNAQVIEYHGDSTVWGYRSGTDAERVETPAPEAFAAGLPEHHEVRNLGLNRSTACDLLEGTGGYQQPWQEHVTASNASVVIINHGINDRSAYDTARYRSCLNQLVDIAQSNDKVVILETPNPVVDDNGRQIIDYVRVMENVAQQQGIYLIDQYNLLIDAFEANAAEVVPDGLHPTQEVYIDKGEFAAERFATFDEP
jgi:lysophospholipase L1-like esterase